MTRPPAGPPARPSTSPPASDVAVATLGAVAVAALVALACLVMPVRLLESLVVRSGVPALVNAAAPPLGFTARLLLASGSGILAGAVGWAVLVLAAGEQRVRVRLPKGRLPDLSRLRRQLTSAGRSVRRGDSHPDAPPRPPILAERELGVPFLSILAPAAPVVAAGAEPTPIGDECPLPALDTPLAVVDPAAILAVPREPVRVVASLVVPPPPSRRPVPLAAGERLDSVELGADVRDRPDSIEGLLARLERGTRRRPAPLDVPTPTGPVPPEPILTGPAPMDVAPTGSLEETLGQLRRLATRS